MNNVSTDTTKQYHSTLKSIKAFFSVSINTNKKLLLYSFIFVFILGFIAHGFALANFTVNHDSLWEFYLSYSAKVKVGFGRISVPAIKFLLGELYVEPWLIGIISFIMISLSTFFVCKAFKTTKLWQLIALSGIMVTNITVIGLIGSYIHDFDVDMMGLFLSVLSFYLFIKWRETKKFHYLIISSIVLSIAIGCYQSYLANFLTLYVIYFIYMLINRDSSVKEELKALLISLALIVASVIIYFLLTLAITKIFGIEFSESRSGELISILTNPITLIKHIAKEYARVLLALFYPNYIAAKGVSTISTYLICIFNIVLMISVIAAVIDILSIKKRGSVIVSIIIAVLVLPFAMSFVSAFTGSGYVLVMNAYWFFYLFVIVVTRESKRLLQIKFKFVNSVIFILVSLIIISNIQMANLVYVKKEAESKATLSFMTSMVNKIETEENYKYGETPVAIIGRDELFESLDLIFVDTEGSERIFYIPGVDYPSAISSYNKLSWYFKVYLHYNINLANNDTKDLIKEKEDYINMPTYPSNGSVKTIDGIIVVKLPE